ncbi:hypothetical protein [Kribbella soli]|uniref:Uncharacterized protein n=1 Tax=Kribbella soli TaxID=1124743 RepID=A0A4R0H476_9ACTN|nr:hypothetical protein [Kribbella soli]TCC05141.1 hypothetical protein E0H45_24105 [Kribbella soli]
MFIIVIAYYLASCWRQLVFLLAVVVISIFGFGIFMLDQLLNGEPPTQGDQFVKTETNSHQR